METEEYNWTAVGETPENEETIDVKENPPSKQSLPGDSTIEDEEENANESGWFKVRGQVDTADVKADAESVTDPDSENEDVLGSATEDDWIGTERPDSLDEDVAGGVVRVIQILGRGMK